MLNQKVGRNDPCPCGSGKKYKFCCLEREASGGQPDWPPQGGQPPKLAREMMAEVQDALEGQSFESMEDMQGFLNDFMEKQQRQAVDDFCGLSPDQMHRLLNLPFDSTDLVVFPERLDNEPSAPIVTLFDCLVQGIGEKGMKPTAAGNLPRAFCREAASVFWGEAYPVRKERFGDIYKEEDFFDLHVTRIIAELAGLVRKYKGRFILSRQCRDMIAASGYREIYSRLFRTGVREYNWAYETYGPEQMIIQSSFAFTLFLLTRFGDVWRPEGFYSDAFIRAFPMALEAEEMSWEESPEKALAFTYETRALHRFAALFGLVETKNFSDDFLRPDRQVKSLPMLRQAVQFRLTAKTDRVPRKGSASKPKAKKRKKKKKR